MASQAKNSILLKGKPNHSMKEWKLLMDHLALGGKATMINSTGGEPH